MLRRLIALVLCVIACDVVYSEAWFKVVDENRSWTYAPGWQSLKDASQNGGLPSAADVVELNNVNTTPATPLLITNGVNVEVKALRLGTIEGDKNNYKGDGRIIGLKMEGGFLHTADGVDNLVSGYATNGYGSLVVTGGMISNEMLTVGFRGQGVATNAGGTISIGWVKWWDDDINGFKYGQNDYRGFNIGQGASSSGRVYQVSGTLSAPLHVGIRGYGEFHFLGGTVENRDVRIGEDVTGRGYMNVCSENECMNAKTFYVGFKGVGTMDVKTSAWCEYLKIGGSLDVGMSAVNVYDGGTVTVRDTCYVGGYRGWQSQSDSVVVNMRGRGEMCLRGGELKFEDKSDVPVRFFVNGMTNENPLVEGFGRLCGYGKVQYNPGDGDRQKIRMMMNGVVEADGYGTERELFLGHVVSSETAKDAPFDWTTTNGWYAVNKGILAYPRSWVGSETGDKTFIFGNRWLAADSAETTTNKLAPVNSILVTTRGGTGGNRTWFCNLYAKDCDVIPAGLPTDKKYVGVWSLNLYKQCGTFEQSGNADGSYSSMDITFRYDHTKVTARDNIHLYKYTNELDGWKWVRLGKYKAADLQARPLISVKKQPHLANATKDNGAAWNANGGWYAIVAGPDNGTLLVIR